MTTNEPSLKGLPSPLETGENLLLYGVTGSGKTTQVIELIKVLARPEAPALVYIADKGGSGGYKALERKGLVVVEEYRGGDRFIWVDNAVQGRRWVEGKWVQVDLTMFSLVVFESLSGIADLILNALGHQAAAGNNVGGEPAPGLKIQAEGQVIMVPSGSRTHYLVTQRHLLEKVWQSQTLPLPVVWTADEDIATIDKKMADGSREAEIAVGLGIRGIIGPMVAGSALTMKLPKYFVYTFRLSTIVTEQAKRHVMYTGRHKDGQLEGLANSRAVLGSKVALRVEPTDVVGTLRLIKGEMNNGKG